MNERDFQRDALLRAAMAWIARQKTGPFTTRDAADLASWRTTSAAHEEAYQQAAAIGSAPSGGGEWPDPGSEARTGLLSFARPWLGRRAFMTGTIAATAASVLIMNRSAAVQPRLGPVPGGGPTILGHPVLGIEGEAWSFQLDVAGGKPPYSNIRLGGADLESWGITYDSVAHRLHSDRLLRPGPLLEFSASATDAHQEMAARHYKISVLPKGTSPQFFEDDFRSHAISNLEGRMGNSGHIWKGLSNSGSGKLASRNRGYCYASHAVFRTDWASPPDGRMWVHYSVKKINPATRILFALVYAGDYRLRFEYDHRGRKAALCLRKGQSLVATLAEAPFAWPVEEDAPRLPFEWYVTSDQITVQGGDELTLSASRPKQLGEATGLEVAWEGASNAATGEHLFALTAGPLGLALPGPEPFPPEPDRIFEQVTTPFDSPVRKGTAVAFLYATDDAPVTYELLTGTDFFDIGTVRKKDL